jgi:phosphonate transport system substrate-binding protein
VSSSSPDHQAPRFSRRRFIAAGAALAACRPALSAPQPLRIGTTAVILHDQVGFLNAWRAYLEQRLETPVQFVQRGAYREINDLLRADEIDFAWVCGYPYARNRNLMRLLAMPLWEGRPAYRSYLIVPATDRATTSLADLAGKVFAYSDPDSNSGFLVPQYELHRLDRNPAAFFRRTFFTYAHSKVVHAVGQGLANGGAVDGYVWETIARQSPPLAAATRVAWRSDEYGFPPLVARRSIPPSTFDAMQRALIGMSADPAGRALLRNLNLDGFALPDERVFDGIAGIVEFVAARQRLPA